MASNYEANKRWRLNNPKLWAAQKKRNYARGASPGGALRRKWLTSEDELILHNDRPDDRELAKQLNCSVQAIQVRRSKLLKAKSITQRRNINGHS